MKRKQTFSLESANQMVLGNLNLLERAGLDQLSLIPRSTVGLHSSRFPSPFFSIAARVNIESFDSVISEIYQSSDYVRQRGLRGTIFIHHRQDAPYFHKATLKKRNQACTYILKRYGITKKMHSQACEDILNLLESEAMAMEYGALTTAVQKRLSKKRLVTPVIPKMALRTLWENGEVIRYNQSPEWKKEKKVFALNKNVEWKAAVDSISEEGAQEVIIKRYFKYYGPATISDAAWWSEITPSRIERILRQHKDEFAEIAVQGTSTPFFTHVDNIESAKSNKKLETHVKLLAYEDNLLKGFKETRFRFTDPKYTNLVYNASGESNASILVNGNVQGTWRLNINRIEAKIFDSFPTKCFSSLAKELDRLSGITGYEHVILSKG